MVDALSSRDSAIHRPGGVSARFQRAPISKKAQLGHLEGAKIHDERDRNRGLRGAVRALGGAAYSPRAAPSILTKGEPTGTRAQAPFRSCTCAKALTETHPGVRMADGDWKSH